MNISKDLENKIRQYLEFVWAQEERENPEQENMIINKLTSSLKDQIFLETRVKYLKTVPLFEKSLSDKTLGLLASTMKKVRYSPEEYIYKVFFNLFKN